MTLDATAEDEIVQIEQNDDTQIGYGLKGVSAPIISANSDWGGACMYFSTWYYYQYTTLVPNTTTSA